MLCLAGLVCSAAVLVLAPAAAAGNVTCDGVLSGPISGNVIVPKGADCELQLAAVSGNVTAQVGATVDVLGSTVGGNYTCNNCEQAHLETSTINGNVQISRRERVQRDRELDDQGKPRDQRQPHRHRAVLHRRERDRRNLTFNNNEGLAFIMDNAIKGNITCENNEPAPFSEGDTAKSMEGQCAA